MSPLLSIHGLDQPFLELLEVAGFYDFKDLAEADEEDLVRELERANQILKITESVPDLVTVAAWIRHAREEVGITVEEPVHAPVNYENDSKVLATLRFSPLAIPLHGTALKDKGLSVSDIPSGFLLTDYPGDLDMRMETKFPKMRADAEDQSPNVQSAESFSPQKAEMDFSRLKSVGDLGPTRLRGHGAPVVETEDRVALIRAPKASTNKGRDPESRRFIRGVLHSHPGNIYSGAIFTLLLMVTAPVAVVAAFLLLLSREMPDKFGWVEPWWLAAPLALPVFAIAWVIWGASGKCRVCGQKLFIHRAHRKNVKAHYLPGLGFVLPLCFHILFYHWFRCTHCGTPVRLKK